MVLKIEMDRVFELGKAFSVVKPYIPYIHVIDPQYWSIKRVIEVNSDTGVLLVVGNSIVSYRLMLRGEDYWNIFAEYANRFGEIDKYLDWFAEFLKKYNRIRFADKMSRVRKLYNSILFRNLSSKPYTYCDNLSEFNRILANTLKSELSAKTIVFTTKMYYYACLASGTATLMDFDIEFPVDRRNAALTVHTCMVKCTNSYLKCIDLLMSRYRNVVISVWKIVSKTSGIPPLIIDTFTWILRGLLDRGVSHRDIVKNIKEKIPEIKSDSSLNSIFNLVVKLDRNKCRP
ncbi:MAG: N-glycosylase/DNA lyase [Thermoprotei archaeon]